VTAYRIRHDTVYEYAEPVAVSHNEAHVLPRRLPRQTLHQLSLRVDPTPETVAWRQDWFGNDVVFIALGAPHERLAIRAASRVEVQAPEPVEPERSSAWEAVTAAVRERLDDDALAALEHTFPSSLVPVHDEIAAFARPSFPPGRPLLEGVLELSGRIHREFRYDPEATTVATPVLEVLRARRGVCQDFAHLLLSGLRSLGLPARYVSGYLRTQVGPPASGEAGLVGADASHAWVSVWCPEQGWVDVDPTNDLVPTDRHVTLAFGRDYEDVSPVKGVTVGGGLQTMTVRVEVLPDAEP
jgi:transglutaminase-like putative cysteine protease